MSDDKPTPLEDVRKGLGLLFRAAKTAVEKLETRGVEDVVMTSAREVGRAIENVASAIEREVFGAAAAKKGEREADRDRQRQSESDHPEETRRDDPPPPDEPKR
jgi:hypothetical protein